MSMKKQKSKQKSDKKRSSKNLKVNTRIVLTAILAIVIPIIIIVTFSTVFMSTFASSFNLSSVTTNTYGTINQIQWSQTLWGITNTLSDTDENEQEKLQWITDFCAPLEELDSYIYIEKDSQAFYATDNNNAIFDMANKIVPVDKNENINYFGNNGLVIVNRMNTDSGSYIVIIVNDNYTVNDVSQKMSIKDLSNLVLSRTGILIFIIVALFAAAIVIISFITTKTIVNPIKKIARGADEIARGNLDYSIDYNSTNELGQTVHSFNDMRIRLKESIEQQRNAEEERRVLVAGIAHDLRTPLTSARGYAEGLLDGIADTPEKKERYIKTIYQSISNTQRILDDLLTVSRLELRGYELNLMDINAREFFFDGAYEIKQLLDKADFDFEYECNCSEEAVISLDVDRFERVISNIVSNSIKYSHENIKGKFTMLLNEYERSIIIELSDNGIGVDAESLPKIFDTMFRADPARTRVADGSGLGLAVCKQIVTLHGGSIWASSRPGSGLSIFISLPKKNTGDNSDEQNTDN